MALQGRLEVAGWNDLRGWAYDPERPGEPVELEVLDNGETITRLLAAKHRPDLERAGLGDGRCSFGLRLPHGWLPLQRHVIQVRRASDGAELPGSPAVLQPEARLDGPLKDALGAALRAVEQAPAPRAGAEIEAAVARLVRRLDELLRARVALDGGEGVDAALLDAFYARWGPLLPARPLPRRKAALLPRPRPRALVIAGVLPDAGEGIADPALDAARALRRLGYEVVLAPADMRRHEARAAWLEAEGIACYHAPLFASVEEVLRRHAALFDAVHIEGLPNCLRYGAMARHELPRARLVHGLSGLVSLRLARQAEAESQPELHAEAERFRASEIVAAWSADAVVVQSPHEAEVLRRAIPAAAIHVVPPDVAPRPEAAPFAARHGLALVVPSADAAARDAAAWFAARVLPELRARVPEVQCRLVLAGGDARGLRTGAWPDALLPSGEAGDALGRARVAIAPMRHGAGLNAAVLASLAAGIPCVCTPRAAEGLDLPATLAPRLVAPDPASLAALVHRLHADEAENADCARAGLAHVAERFSAAARDGALRQALGPPPG